VQRGSTDAEAARAYAIRYVADADFGMILQLITTDYAELIPAFHNVLGADRSNLDGVSVSLHSTADAYRAADQKATHHLAELPGGQTVQVEDDGVANGFDDKLSPADELTAPLVNPRQLPEVSLGWLLDHVCDLIVWVGGPDPREYVTKWIVGDINKAAMQVAAWRAVADCVDAIESNLASGRAAIEHTWTGRAAVAAEDHMGLWEPCLLDQANTMRTMGLHLSETIDEAVKMAQVVVDLIRTVISVVSAGLTNAAIPFYGQWKLIESVKEGIKIVWSAIKVIRVFWNFLKTIVATIQMAVGGLSIDKLPAPPAPVPAV
jgi:hypothetical protein